ncbi:unnamed protein product [Euphydryas editha]|uniref:Histone-lysine N-methyltransferase SETMAR n=1 Tax=Euphydryas editha TaxID=104508 RepID=A0AAU9V896_EUPED|nr:unnamed protein product [Euphydryas editha]
MPLQKARVCSYICRTPLGPALDAIKEKRRGKLSRGVMLLHDNAPVHISSVSMAAIKECGFTELNHPPYRPDLAPSDKLLFILNIEIILTRKKV